MHPLTRGRDCSCVVEGMRRGTSPAFTIADEWHPRHVIPGRSLYASRAKFDDRASLVYSPRTNHKLASARASGHAVGKLRARGGKCGEVILANGAGISTRELPGPPSRIARATDARPRGSRHGWPRPSGGAKREGKEIEHDATPLRGEGGLVTRMNVRG